MSSGLTREYDPGQINANLGGRDLSGFAKGTFIEVDRAVDVVTEDVGADGEVTIVISQNRSGTIKITLQQASPLNDYLSSLATALENRNMTLAIQPFLLKDSNGTTVVSAKQCWVRKKAKADFAVEAENREWIIATGYLNYDVGGEAAL